MKKRRLELLLIVLTVLAMGAGVAAGLLAARLPASGPTTVPASGDVTPLVAELNLTPSQRDQMRSVWERVRVDIRDSFDRAQRLQKRRDDAILAIMTDDQKARFEIIAREHADLFSDLTRERDRAFQEAVKQTKTLLNQDQQQKYDQILESRGAIPAGATLPGRDGQSR